MLFLCSQLDNLALRIEWCKAHACAHRWQEECLLLAEEMLRILVAFFTWQENEWKSHTMSFPSTSDNLLVIVYWLRVRLLMCYNKQTSELRRWKFSRLNANGMSANLKCVLLQPFWTGEIHMLWSSVTKYIMSTWMYRKCIEFIPFWWIKRARWINNRIIKLLIMEGVMDKWRAQWIIKEMMDN